MFLDVRQIKNDHAVTCLGFAFIEVNQRVGSIEGKIEELEGKIDELDDFCQELEELRESWLERNVAAEGEVVVLRERGENDPTTGKASQTHSQPHS